MAKSRQLHYGWIILALGVLVVYSSLGLARFGYTMILPSMQKGLGLNNTQAGSLATGNFIGYLALALVGGFLAARFSPRKVIALSLLLVGVTMLLTATSSNFVSALIWRIFTGMGSGGSNVPVMGLLAAWFAKNRRGLATGIGVSGSSIGLIVTGLLIPIIIDTFGEDGWRYGWVFLGSFVIVIGILAFLLLRNVPGEKGLLPVGETTEPASPPPGAMSKPDAVLSWGNIYKSFTVWHLALIYTTFGFSYIIYLTFFARFLQTEAGLTKEGAGRLFQVIGWLSIFCGILWGWVSDILGRKYGLALVSLLQGTAYMLFALSTSSTYIWISVVIFGITAWSIPAMMAAACGDRLGPRLAPAALGFVTLFFGIGQAIAPAIAGNIADTTGSFATSFGLAAAVAWLGAVFSLLLPRAH